ncbi:MAG: glycosyltransferase [Bacteroidales bacterium]|nr:glycosyltransferase [Bacteroidales bacterium]
MKISIIVAVYNAADYLKRCLDSIKKQSFKDWECLLVDDGSTDSSGEICDNFSREDSRFRVFHKKNGGVGSARRVGIDNASGTYSIHFDADDWAEPEMLSTLYSTAVREDADMVICDYFEDIGNRSRIIRQDPGRLTNKNIIRGLSHKLHGSCWNKLISLDCYKQFGLNFTDGIDFGEDRLMLHKLLSNPMKISYCPQAFYHYMRYEDKQTATNDFSESMVKKKIHFLSLVAEYSPAGSIYNEAVAIAYKCMKSGSLPKKKFKELFSPVLSRVRFNSRLPFRKLIAILFYWF